MAIVPVTKIRRHSSNGKDRFKNAAMSRMIDLAFAAKSGSASRVGLFIVRFLFGGVALAVVTLIGSPFEVHRGAVALIYLMIVAVVSLTGDLISSAAIAIAAALCLRYFFAPPPGSARIGCCGSHYLPRDRRHHHSANFQNATAYSGAPASGRIPSGSTEA